MRRHHLPRTGHTGLGGTGSPAQGVVRVSFRAPRGGIIFQEPGTLAPGGRGVQPKGWSEYPSGAMRRHHLPRTGHTGLGGTGSPAQGVVGVSFRPMRRHHLPRTGHTGLGGTGSPAQGMVGVSFTARGGYHFPRTGHTGLGGTGSPAQDVVGVSFKAHGEASSSKNRAHRPGGDGESSPGGGRSIL